VSYLAEEPQDSHTLSHIQQLESDSEDFSSIDHEDLDETLPPGQSHPPVLVSNGFPPIPFKLVKRVEDGLFVEMAELLPSYLDSADLNSGDQSARSRRQPPTVSDIVDWIQCFAVYTAIISRKKPKRVPDLLGYQSLIIGASTDCRQGKWVIYDRRFRLKASASHTEQWSTIDVTLWNMTFPEKAIHNRSSAGSPSYMASSSRPQHQYHDQSICLDWNENPSGCSRSPCRFRHICYRCVHNPRARDKNHKASQCTYRQKDRQYKNRS